MRELTVRLRFLEPCLGAAKNKKNQFMLPRNGNGDVVFMSTWHEANMLRAAQIVGKYQNLVRRILWDPRVDVVVSRQMFRRYLEDGRFVWHEVIHANQVVGINCVVPTEISDDDFASLLGAAGRYCGISPFKHGHYGRFEVEDLIPRYYQE